MSSSFSPRVFMLIAVSSSFVVGWEVLRSIPPLFLFFVAAELETHCLKELVRIDGIVTRCEPGKQSGA
jgi:hypothetical protein